jgi:hypothetical protein
MKMKMRIAQAIKKAKRIAILMRGMRYNNRLITFMIGEIPINKRKNRIRLNSPTIMFSSVRIR